MAVTIRSSQTYQSGASGFKTSHTLPNLDVGGTDSIAIAAGFNLNPTSDVAGWTFAGVAPTALANSITAYSVAIQSEYRVMNNSATSIVISTPGYSLEAIIGVSLEGVNQTTPIVASQVAGGSAGTTGTDTYTGTAGNMLLVFVSTAIDATMTASGVTTQAQVTHADSNQGSGYLGYVTATGSAQTIGATWTGASNWRTIIVEVAAAGSSAVNASIAQIAATLTATDGGGTTVSATAIVSAAITQVAATVTATGRTQVVSAAIIVSIAIAQLAASITGTGGTQAVASVRNVSIAQSAAIVTATGRTQVIASVQNASLAQSGAAVTATGGSQSLGSVVNTGITQVAAALTATGGAQVVASVQRVAIAQTSANLALTGGTQVVASSMNASVAQFTASLTLTGGTQAVAAASSTNAAITQSAATITATGGTQTISSTASAAITQVHATLTATAGTQVLTMMIYKVTIAGSALQSVFSAPNVQAHFSDTQLTAGLRAPTIQADYSNPSIQARIF